MEITTGRPVTMAPNGMVASPHSLASTAGIDVLKSGGSAVDAIIATSAVLGVLYPHMTGIGGDAFWLIYDAKAKKVRYINGGGRAAKSATIDVLKSRGHATIPVHGIEPATLTVPGAVESWGLAHGAYGKLPLQRVLESAIGYAKNGFPVSERLAFFTDVMKPQIAPNPASAKLFLPDGNAPQKGAILSNKGLARTLEAIANDGASGFYKGEIGKALAAFSRDNDGYFDIDDLANQKAAWGQPIKGEYRGVTIYNTPPPTQGFTLLEMLNLVEPKALHKLDMLSSERLHTLVQAKQIAYADRDELLADPDFVDVPVDCLISREYAAKRAHLLDPEKALPWDLVPNHGSTSGDTTYLCAVDAEGNAVSLIQSIYGAYGSGVVAGDTGVLLQNRGAYFSLDPNHANRLEPGKIPMHTLIASIAMKGDNFWGVLGCMGGDGQPQAQLQIYLAMIDYGLDIQEALEMPRFLSGRAAMSDPLHMLSVEARFPDEVYTGLERRGHELTRWGNWSQKAGHAHGIFVDPENGLRLGGADPRSDGAAIGY